MSNLIMRKEVSSLPSQLEPNTLYFVRNGTGFDLFCSDGTGKVAHPVNTVKDTGWRYLQASTLEYGGILIRRVNNIVYVGTGGGDWNSIALKETNYNTLRTSTNNNLDIIQLPVGFQSELPVSGTLTFDGSTPVATLNVLPYVGDTPFVQIKGFVGTQRRLLKSELISYTTSQPFPDMKNLPGVEPPKSFAKPSPTTPYLYPLTSSVEARLESLLAVNNAQEARLDDLTKKLMT